MADFTLVIDIARSPAEVFAFIADPRNMPLWYDAVEEVTKTAPGAPGAGARYEVTRSLPGTRARNDVELTEYAPNRRITLESRSGPTPFRYRYGLEPSADGTVLTLDGCISGAGLPAPAVQLDRVATRLFKRGMARNLHVLKELVEARRVDE